MNQMITTYELGIKAKSKSEVYRLLSTEGKVDLPSASESTITSSPVISVES